MVKVIFTALIFAMLIMIISCKKSTPTPVPTPTDTCKINNANITGRYLKTAEKYKASSSAPEQDLFSSLQDCEKDDLYELKADSSVVVNDGATVCGGPPPPGGISNWFLSNNNTQIVLGGFFKIDSFNCKRLVITEADYFVTGDSRTIVYVKQ